MYKVKVKKKEILFILIKYFVFLFKKKRLKKTIINFIRLFYK